jgi:uncharacterized membrane protein YgcG
MNEPPGQAPPGQAPPGQPPPGQQPSEQELRAQLEEELRRITVLDMLVQTIVSVINLAGQRLGITPDTKDQRDLAQVRLAIESVRALLPVVEQELPEQVQPIRDALAQLQMAYAREAGASSAGDGPGGEGGPSGPGGDQGGGGTGGPTQGTAGGAGSGQEPARPRSSGRLWVPPGSAGS